MAAELALQRRGEAWDLAQAEMTRLGLGDRFRAAIGRRVIIDTRSGRVAGEVAHVGVDHLVVEDERGSVLVAMGGVVGVSGLGGAKEESSRVVAGLKLASACRRLAEEGGLVRVYACRREPFVGRLVRVGADHLDLGGRENVTLAYRYIDYLASY